MNPYDTVVEVTADVSIAAVAQQLHVIHEWEEIPVTVSYIMVKRAYIVSVVLDNSEMIKQRNKAEREIE